MFAAFKLSGLLGAGLSMGISFAMSVAISVLHARRGDGSARKLIDGSLLFGTPLVAFALQARLYPLLGFVALTLWMAAEVHRRRPATALVWTVMSALAPAVPLELWQSHAQTQPFAQWGALAWLAFAVAGARALWRLRMQHDAGAVAAQCIWWLLWPLVVSLGAAWLADAFMLANGWRCALLAAPWLAVTAVGLLRWPWLAWPQGANFDPARNALLSCVFAVLGIGWLIVLLDPVSAAPLPWLPLLNPTELAQLAVLARWAWSAQAPLALQRWRVTALGCWTGCFDHRQHLAQRAALGRRGVGCVLDQCNLVADQPDHRVERAGCAGLGDRLAPRSARSARPVAGWGVGDGPGIGQVGLGRSPASGQPARHRLVHGLRPVVHRGGLSATGTAAAGGY